MDKVFGHPSLSTSGVHVYDMKKYRIHFTEVDVHDGDTIENVRVHILGTESNFVIKKAGELRIGRGVSKEIWPELLLEYDGLWAKFALRINGIDTPEVHPFKHWPDGSPRSDESRLKEHTLAMKARDELVKLNQEYDHAYIRDVQLGKYAGRLVAELVFGNSEDEEGELNYAAHMIASGLAHPYSGGTKAPWDKEHAKVMAKAEK